MRRPPGLKPLLARRPRASMAETMRISVFCGATYMSGAELITLAMMRGLKARGHDVRCVVSGWNDGEFIRELRKSGIEHDEIFLGKIGTSLSPRRLLWTADGIVQLPGALRAARRHFERFQPDVVVATNRDGTFWLRRLLKRQRTVLYVHELADSSRLGRWTYATIDRCIMRYVAVSLSIQNRLVALGIDPARIDLIY